MDPFGKTAGKHVIVTLAISDRESMKVLCLRQAADNGADAYYVLAECGGTALKWRSLIRENEVRRLKDEFIGAIVDEAEVDRLDVEMIFFCSAEASQSL